MAFLPVKIKVEILSNTKLRISGECLQKADVFMLRSSSNSLDLSKAFLGWYDDIKAIRVRIAATAIPSEAATEIYPVGTSGENKYTLDLSNKSTFLTTDTRVQDMSASQAVAERLIESYQNGKYICKLSILSRYAKQAGVVIGSTLQVKNPDNRVIARNGEPCTFEVKSITKDFKAGSGIYNLTLWEV